MEVAVLKLRNRELGRKGYITGAEILERDSGELVTTSQGARGLISLISHSYFPPVFGPDYSLADPNRKLVVRGSNDMFPCRSASKAQSCVDKEGQDKLI